MREFSKLLALATIAPFLLAFAPPEEPGTTVSASAGTGRFVSASGCARPRLVEATDQHVGIHHQWAYRGDKAKRFGIGLEGTVAQSREKECTEEDCRNSGWKDSPVASGLGPYGTLDWKWLGLMLGTQIPLHPLYADTVLTSFHPGRWLGFPARGALRLGYPDRFYVSYEVFAGQPVLSGSTFPIGIGGRIHGTDVWAAPYPDYETVGVSARIARQFGPLRLRLSGRWHRDPVSYSRSDLSDGGGGDAESFRVAVPEFAVAAGFDYHLPW